MILISLNCFKAYLSRLNSKKVICIHVLSLIGNKPMITVINMRIRFFTAIAALIL